MNGVTKTSVALAPDVDSKESTRLNCSFCQVNAFPPKRPQGTELAHSRPRTAWILRAFEDDASLRERVDNPKHTQSVHHTSFSQVENKPLVLSGGQAERVSGEA